MVPAPGSDANERKPPERLPVDSRLLQANERTLLAWLRTGIALMAFGFVLARIGVWLQAIVASPETGFGTAWMGAAFVALGVMANGAAVRRFVRARTAIVAGQEMAPDGFPVFFGVAVTCVGALLSAYVLFRLR